MAAASAVWNVLAIANRLAAGWWSFLRESSAQRKKEIFSFGGGDGPLPTAVGVAAVNFTVAGEFDEKGFGRPPIGPPHE
jgi:hypothetical protein